MQTLKNNWDVLGGTIIGIICSFVVGWEIDKIQLVYSIIILILVIIGLFRFFFKKSSSKKEKDIIDKTLNANKITKAIHIAENPCQEGEELGELVIETINGGKKIMNWINKNKGAIISTLAFILAILENIFNFLYQYLPFDLGFNVVSIALTVVGGAIAVFTSGYGSVKFKEIIAQVKDQLNGDTTDLSDIESLKYLERQIAIYEKATQSVENEIEKLNKEYANAISDYNACQRLGLVLDEETNLKYSEYYQKYNELQRKLNEKSSALNKYKQKLEQLKA